MSPQDRLACRDFAVRAAVGFLIALVILLAFMGLALWAPAAGSPR